MDNKGMYKTKCDNCGKEMFTYAKNRLGELPVVYCSKACESTKKYNRRFVNDR